MPKVRILAGDAGNAAGTKKSKGSELAVGTEKIDSETEFVLIASTGIWEVRYILHVLSNSLVSYLLT